MRKKPQPIFWIILALFLIIFVAAFQYNNKKNNQKNTNESVANQNESGDIEDANENIKGEDEEVNGSSSDLSVDIASARDNLGKYLKAITASEKASVKNYTTDQFYAESFTKDILSGSSFAPDAANIMDEGQIIDGDFVFQVNESYNINNHNNAGVNGTYTYRLTKLKDQWLVSFRSES